MMTATDPEIAIVGAGPIGIELAVALKKRGIPYLHFDAKQIGSTMFWWPPQTRWFSSNDRISIAGVPLQTVDQSKATREEYLRYLRSVVLQFDLNVHTYEPVTGIEKSSAGFIIKTHPAQGEQIYRAKRVVLATGGTAYPRHLNVPGEDLPQVSHYMADPHMYFRRRVLVVGGRNSAIEAALRCHYAGAEVALSYRQSSLDKESIKYWLYPEISSLCKSGKIRAYFNTVVTRIAPAEVTLSPCAMADGVKVQVNESFAIPADFVLLMVGYLADMSLCRMAGVELAGSDQRPIYNEQTMETNVPGVYIAGTVMGGTQSKYRVFLENCHIHIDRIVAAIIGEPAPPMPELPARPES
jgi:thioredoxin reductase (NADPH)